MADDANTWIHLKRDYEKEAKARVLIGEKTLSHPLLTLAQESIIKSQSKSEKDAVEDEPTPISPPVDTLIDDPLSAESNAPVSKVGKEIDFLDPLGSSAPIDVIDDPLRALSLDSPDPLTSNTKSDAVVYGFAGGTDEVGQEGVTFIPWAARKGDILSRYTTSEQIVITANFLDDQDVPKAQNVSIKTSDKQKSRLEQLEEPDVHEQQQLMKVTQKEYITHIEGINEELSEAWENEDRVKALKLAIQAAKFLGDTKVVRFFPSQFVLLTEILDTFSRLVYQRLKSRASSDQGALPDDFTASMVSLEAKETCRNWFYKIASIRELLPRLYVEIALLPTYRFLSDNEFPRALIRLSSMVRGIGDPMVALYCRAYLARKGYENSPQQSDYLLNSFYDFLFSLRQLEGEGARKWFKDKGLTPNDYFDLLMPALEWVMQCIAAANSEPKLFVALGTHLVMTDPPKGQALQILNEVWKVVAKFKDPEEYIEVADAFIEYPMKHLQLRDLNVLLGDVRRHVGKDHAFEKLGPRLQSIVTKVMSHMGGDMLALIGLDNFMPLLDLFHGDSRLEVCRNVLECFGGFDGKTSDPSVINAMFDAAKTLHDGINPLSFHDDIRQISGLIIQFIRKVGYGDDFQTHLNFYVDCRRVFSNLEKVKDELVLRVNALCMDVFRVVRGRHNRKTAAFARACISFCFITIPSLESPLSRINLYRLSAEVALANQSLPQVDALIRAAITLISDVPVIFEQDNKIINTQKSLVDAICALSSLMVVVPGHPEQGPLYLIKGLLNVVESYAWEAKSDGKALVYVHMIELFTAFAQDRLPYHVPRVDSNDALYGGDQAYLKELRALTARLVDQILELLAKMVEPDEEGNVKSEAKERQGQVALDLFNVLISCIVLNRKTASLCYKLFQLAYNSGAIDSNILRSTIDSVGKREGSLYAELHKKLAV